MSSVNKQSVREEVDRIKSELDHLSVNKKIGSEIKILLQSMLMLINSYGRITATLLCSYIPHK